MDQTAIQPGMPLAKPSETGIQEPPPPPAPKMQREPKNLTLRVLETLADLRITVVLFSLAMVLVFWGTLAQVDNGVWTVVRTYFRSYFVWVPLKVVFFNAINNTQDVIPFPGGWLIGSAMFFNLLAAHAIRFKLAWNRSGIFMIHIGIIIMMVGEYVTGQCAIEGQMVIPVGQTSNTVIHADRAELAIVQTLDDKKDDTVTVPARLLQPGKSVEHADVPFKIEVLEYMVNSDLQHVPGNKRSTNGFGKQHIAREAPEVSGVDPNQRHDIPAAYVKLTARDGTDLGIWLFTPHFGDPQWVTTADKKKYQVTLRFQQKTRDFTIRLDKFIHDKFPGTEKPRDFRSFVHISDPGDNVERDVQIYMNTPLYYRGETFYQSSWTTGMDGQPNGTILQVVRNPGWLLPYVSCFVVGFGLLIHFGLTLFRFIERRIVR